MTHWAKTKERGSVKGMVFILYVLKFLGTVVCKVFLTPVLIYFFVTKKAPRTQLKTYLSLLSKLTKDAPKPSLLNAFKIICNYGYGYVDRIAAWQGRLTIKQFNKHNGQLFKSLVEQKQGAILLVSHLGNFEITRAVGNTMKDVKLTVFMHTDNSAKMTQALKKVNPEYDLTVIQGNQLDIKTAITLKEQVEQGGFVVIAGDRVPVDNEAATLTTEFLGENAHFPIGPYVMAKVLQCPILCLFCLKTNHGYDVYFESLAEKVVFNRSNRNQILQTNLSQYANILEKYVKKAPLQWYNFHPFWNP